MKKTNLFRGFAAVFSVIFALVSGGSAMAFANPSLVNDALHIRTSRLVDTEDTEAVYFSCDYASAEALIAAKKELIARIGEEGCVLLYNEGGLPLAASDTGISLFGRGSVDFVYDTSNGGASLGRRAFGAPQAEGNYTCVTLDEALRAAGKDVNPVLVDFYLNRGERRTTAGMRGRGFTIGEVPLSEYPEEVKASYEAYHDAAVIVFSRRAGEGGDIPVSPSGVSDGDGVHHYLQIQDHEAALVKEAKENGFGKVVVVLNTDYVLGNLEALKPYADAILVMGSAGYTGLQGLADILTGKADPSGHLAETFAFDPAAAPSVVNAGEFAWTNPDDIVSGTSVTANQVNYYVVYAENIYTGYRYYETRYEDCVLKQGNAKSAKGASRGTSWEYSREVEYGFGFGLSYTTFSEEIVSVDRRAETVTVKVKNTGKTAGKHVVQVYVQTPYTDYDRANGVEKAAVTLLAFSKTDLLAPGEQVTVTVPYDSHLYASYDRQSLKSYFLDAGTYYFALGNGAHDALNNILAKKGYTVSDGMDRDGDAEKVFAFSMSDPDLVTYTVSAYTGAAVTNRFDDADLNYYMPGTVRYLSRTDWQGTYPKAYTGLAANEALIAGLSKFRYALGTTDSAARFLELYGVNGEIPPFSVSENTPEEGGKPLIAAASMIGVRWDDPLWEAFLDQLSYHDLSYFFGDGKHHTYACANISYPGSYELDGPSGNNAEYIHAEDETIQRYNSRMFGSQTLLARTFSAALANAQGRMFGNDGFYNGCHAAWGIGLNWKRTPFCGRNTEYLSEDAVLDYYLGAELASGAAEKGFSLCPKHFAFNDQETRRQGLSVFANEQQIRENELRAFEGAFTVGGAKGTMTSFARIGTTYTSAEFDLMTGMLVIEWGSHAFSITDTVSGSSDKAHGFMEGPESLLAGTAFMDSNISDGYCAPYTSDIRGPLSGTAYKDSGGVKYGTVGEEILKEDRLLTFASRIAAKKILYQFINSAAMNGIGADARVVSVTPWWQPALIGAEIVLGVLSVLFTALYLFSLKGFGKGGAA